MLPVVRLIRLEEDESFGTFGVLVVQAEVFCVTLEPADMENAPSVSSIPAQQYACQKVISPKYGETFEITKVPGRTHILFHAGNVIGDTAGCILLAQHFGKLRGDRAILNSGKTFVAFMSKMGKFERFKLTVKEHY